MYEREKEKKLVDWHVHVRIKSTETIFCANYFKRGDVVLIENFAKS